MRLSVHHTTRFEFDRPSGHSIHDVRLTPRPANGQRILSWRIEGPGKRSEWLDGHGNQVTTFSVAHQHDSVEIAVAGLYEFVGADQWLRYAETPTLPPPLPVNATIRISRSRAASIAACCSSSAANSAERRG